MKKIILVILVIALAGGLYGWFFVYNKPHTNFEFSNPDYKLTAQQLFNDFSSGKGKDYSGKVIEINGIAQKTDISDTLATLVFVFHQGMFGDEGIRCILIPKFNTQLKKLVFPVSVKVKGFCAGYNDTDVILEHCSFTN